MNFVGQLVQEHCGSCTTNSFRDAMRYRKMIYTVTLSMQTRCIIADVETVVFGTFDW